MEMRGRDGHDWKVLYPKTLADNVSMRSGESIQEKVEEIEGKFPEDITLWEGSSLLTDGDVVEPNKPLSECANGWIFRWQGYTPEAGIVNANFQYPRVPKLHAQYNNSGSVRFTLGWTGGNEVYKFVYVHNDKIVGHSSNSDGNNNRIALTGIFEC